MKVREATDRDQEHWDNVVFASPHGSFMQAWEWGEMQRRFGQRVWRLMSEDGSAVAMVVKRELPLGRSWLYVPRGPVIPHPSPPLSGRELTRDTPPDRGEIEGGWASLQEGLVELGREQGALFIRIDPAFAEASAGKSDLVQRGWRKADHEVQPRHTVILDLSLSEEELLKQMHSKTRYNIRLAEKRGVTVRFSKDEKDLEHFLRLAKEVSGRAPIAYHPADYYREMLRVPFVELAIAEHGGDVLAVNIVASVGDEATYVHGASSQNKKQLMAPHLLQWETIKKAKQEGFLVYDLFGVAPASAKGSGEAKPHPWAGITRFKEGFGGKRESYMGAYDFVLESGLYHAFHVARRMRGILR